MELNKKTSVVREVKKIEKEIIKVIRAKGHCITLKIWKLLGSILLNVSKGYFVPFF